MDSNAIIDFVNSAGPFGPLVYILVQILQTIVAPIPGNVVGAIGGFLFGTWGILWTTIGSTIGVAIVFVLTKKFGRKLILKLIKEKRLKQFDRLADAHGGFVFFLLFLIPGLPDDIISYVAGLSKVPIPQLLVLWVVGRLPAVIVTNYIGAGIEEGSLVKVGIILGISALIVGVLTIKNQEIIAFLEKKFGTKKRH